jgi:RNA polymerase sigma factor (sigma-70 family)
VTPHSSVVVLEFEHTDETLVERVRRGDNGAFEELYRRHSGVAVAVARKILGSPQDAEDAVSEAFTNVLSSLRRQVGPREMFRPYLLTCVRNSCLQRIRRSKQACQREGSFADDQPLEDERIVESAVVAAAFRSMPARWQSALWMAEVQQLDPVTIAERLDVSVASAGALVYRARQGFTEAYLAQHLSHAGRPACAALAPKLAQYVRGTAGLMASRRVKNHIDECPACTSAIAELADVNSSLRSLTPPLALLSAAGTTTAAISGGSATVVVSGFGLGWLAKIAAIAVLSTTPVLLGSDASEPANAMGRVPANVGGSRSTDFDTHATHTRGPHAGPRDPAVADSAPIDATSPGTVKTSTGLTTGGTADVDAPPGSSTEVPSPADDGTSVVSDVADIATAPTLPAVPAVTLPTVPAISVPAIPVLPAVSIPAIGPLPPISVPAITVPAVTLPSITVPPITVPPITVPPITVPPITVPPITVPSLPTLPSIPGLPVVPIGPRGN